MIIVADPANLPPLEQLPGLPSVQLINDRAIVVKPGFEVTPENTPAVAQVYKRLDGIPLAIELAVARVSAFSPKMMAERLDNRFHLLTGGSRTAIPSQQTLRASIAWSYSLLSEAERLLLMHMSVFQGGWILELAPVMIEMGQEQYEQLFEAGKAISVNEPVCRPQLPDDRPA
jgi:predicted ATPase